MQQLDKDENHAITLNIFILMDQCVNNAQDSREFNKVFFIQYTKNNRLLINA